MGSKENYEDEYEDVINIDLKKYIKIFFPHWKKIIIWGVIGGFVGIFIAFSKPKTYVSTTVFAPELTNRVNSGGLTSLASLAGLSANMMTVTDAMHTDVYPAIVTSPNFIVGLLNEQVEFYHKDTLVHTDLYDYYLNYTKSPWWSAIISFPFTVIGFIKDKINNEPEEMSGHSEINPIRLTREQAGIVAGIKKSISASIEKKSYIITINVKTQNKFVSSALANAITKHLEQFVKDYRTAKNKENVKYFEILERQTQEDYLNKQEKYALYLDSNQSIFSKKGLVEQQNLQNEMNLAYQIYNQTAQNLMNSKAKLQLHSPVLVIIQPGMVPLKGSPSKMKYMILFGILAAIICCGRILINDTFKK